MSRKYDASNLKNLFDLIKSDAYRYCGNTDLLSMTKLYFRTAGFNYTVKMRTTKYCKSGRFSKIFFPITYLLYRKAMYKYGIIIPYSTKIGYGLYIGHFGGIVVSSSAIIGNNCNLSQGVTVGKGGQSEKSGCPVIGDNVYIGPNVVIAGKIFIGNNSAVGANSFVNKDVKFSTTVGGVPAKIISSNGSNHRINYQWDNKTLSKESED